MKPKDKCARYAKEHLQIDDNVSYKTCIEITMTDPMYIVCSVFKAFDKDNDSYISMEEWVKGLSVFLRGTLDEHMKCKSYVVR